MCPAVQWDPVLSISALEQLCPASLSRDLPALLCAPVLVFLRVTLLCSVVISKQQICVCVKSPCDFASYVALVFLVLFVASCAQVRSLTLDTAGLWHLALEKGLAVSC